MVELGSGSQQEIDDVMLTRGDLGYYAVSLCVVSIFIKSGKKRPRRIRFKGFKFFSRYKCRPFF